MRKLISHSLFPVSAFLLVLFSLGCHEYTVTPCGPGSLEIARPVTDTSNAGIVFGDIQTYLDSLDVDYVMAPQSSNSQTLIPVYRNEYVVKWDPIGTKRKQEIREKIAGKLRKSFCWHQCMCDINIEVWTTDDVLTEDDESTAMSDPGIESIERNFILWTEHLAAVASISPDISLADTTNPRTPPVVAILDTGFDFDNKEYRALVGGYNLWLNPEEKKMSGDVISSTGPDNDDDCLNNDVVGWDFVHDDNSPQDEQGHGTHVTSLIASVREDMHFRYNIMPVRVFDGRGNGSLYSVVCGIRYAVEHGARFINASWGYYGDESPILASEIENAVMESGVVFFASVGNRSVDTRVHSHWPSQFHYTGMPEVIAVGADHDLIDIWDGSNYYESDQLITARGVEIRGFIPVELDPALSVKTGTSMAVPQVLSVWVDLDITMADSSTMSTMWSEFEADFLQTTSSSLRPQVIWKPFEP